MSNDVITITIGQGDHMIEAGAAWQIAPREWMFNPADGFVCYNDPSDIEVRSLESVQSFCRDSVAYSYDYACKDELRGVDTSAECDRLAAALGL